MRGKLDIVYLNIPSPRITPAGAGKTLDKTQTSCAIWDHPRRCGENAPAEGLNLREKGSPPQVRGKHTARYTIHDLVGITPAGAGKTLVGCPQGIQG